jgi:hypothetical protein
MAPALDVPQRLEAMAGAMDAGFDEFLRQISPSEIPSLPCPVWIYQARDDDNVPAAQSEAFAKKHGAKVTLRLADRGGHGGAYTDGLPQAAAFLGDTLRAQPPQQVAAAPTPAPAGADGLGDDEKHTASVPASQSPPAPSPSSPSRSNTSAQLTPPAPANPQRPAAAPAAPAVASNADEGQPEPAAAPPAGEAPLSRREVTARFPGFMPFKEHRLPLGAGKGVLITVNPPGNLVFKRQKDFVERSSTPTAPATRRASASTASLRAAPRSPGLAIRRQTRTTA